MVHPSKKQCTSSSSVAAFAQQILSKNKVDTDSIQSLGDEAWAFLQAIIPHPNDFNAVHSLALPLLTKIHPAPKLLPLAHSHMSSGEARMEIFFVPGGRLQQPKNIVISKGGILADPINRISAQESINAFFNNLHKPCGTRSYQDSMCTCQLPLHYSINRPNLYTKRNCCCS
jgi:hypothetical protein